MTQFRIAGLAQACGWRAEDVVQLEETTENSANENGAANLLSTWSVIN